MATIQQVYEDFAKINLREALPAMIVEGESEIKELVTGQLIEGKLSTGSPIAPSYASTYYSKKKFALNSAPGYGVPDLKVNGKYYEGITVTAESDEYDIVSPVDWPSVMQYGPEALMLSEQSKETFCDTTLGPAITKYIEEITGLVLI